MTRLLEDQRRMTRLTAPFMQWLRFVGDELITQTPEIAQLHVTIHMNVLRSQFASVTKPCLFLVRIHVWKGFIQKAINFRTSRARRATQVFW